MTKKQLKEMNKKRRVMISMDTGVRVFKSGRDYDRRQNKVDLRKVD